MEQVLLQCPQCERMVWKTNVNNMARFFCFNCKVDMVPVPYGFQWPPEVAKRMFREEAKENEKKA